MSTVKNAFTEINKTACFGYQPISASTKPAHLANGWFRRILGKRYDAVLLNQTVVHWTQKGEKNPSSKLLDDQQSIFGPFVPESKRREFDEFRADLKSLVSPFGGAVNDGNRLSSYNITCDRHVTEDYNDRETGAFLYHLIAADLGTGPSPVLSLIKDILIKPKDEVSTITTPLLSNAIEKDVTIGTYSAETVFRKRGKMFVSPILRQLRTGFDRLAQFELTSGGGLDALRRAVAFGVFSVLLHLHNRGLELAGTARISPVLLYFPERHRSTTRHASHATYNLNWRSIESLYTGQFKEWLENRIGKRPPAQKCEKFISELEFGRNDENDKSNRKQLLRAYQTFAIELGHLDGMAEALRETFFRDLSGTPVEFYRGLGVRAGFLKPAGNSAVRKYYTLDGILLEAVLASVLPEGELPYEELLSELSERYGLLIGGRTEDSRILMANEIGIATVQDLRANSTVFRQQLLSLGWARQYADGVLIVRPPRGSDE